MGGGAWSDAAFASVSSARAHKSEREVFSAHTMHEAVDPAKLVVRESRDSDEHPESTGGIVGFDNTGSMGSIPTYFAKEGLGDCMRDLLKKKPVPDPQLLVAAIGDSTCDRYPLQVGQFESDNRIDEWLTKIVLEGGGGDPPESYGLLHHFAATRTSIDCFEKRGRKGFLFTVGDETAHETMRASEIRRVFGDAQAEDVTLAGAIAAAQRMYDVIHVVVNPGGGAARPDVVAWWRKYLGQNVLVLDDYKALAELFTATLAIRHGMTAEAATAGFGHAATALVLRSGVTSLATAPGSSSGVVRL